MKISQQAMEVFVASELAWNSPTKEVAKKAKCYESAARYQKQKLVSSGLAEQIPIFNMYLLGYNDYTFFFTSDLSLKEKTKKDLHNYLIDSPQVSWFGELGGRYSYGISILSKNVSEALMFIELLSKKFPGFISERSFAIRLASNIYGKKYLASHLKLNDQLSYSVSHETLEITEEDKRILTTMIDGSFKSVRDLARKCQLPHNTLNSKIKKLEKMGIIVGYVNGVESYRLGYEQYKLILSFKSRENDTVTKLKDFCKKHIHITHIIECIGEWDFEVSIETAGSSQLIEVTRELVAQFGWALAKTEIIPELRCHKFRNCPF